MQGIRVLYCTFLTFSVYHQVSWLIVNMRVLIFCKLKVVEDILWIPLIIAAESVQCLCLTRIISYFFYCFISPYYCGFICFIIAENGISKSRTFSFSLDTSWISQINAFGGMTTFWNIYLHCLLTIAIQINNIWWTTRSSPNIDLSLCCKTAQNFLKLHFLSSKLFTLTRICFPFTWMYKSYFKVLIYSH